MHTDNACAWVCILRETSSKNSIIMKAFYKNSWALLLLATTLFPACGNDEEPLYPPPSYAQPEEPEPPAEGRPEWKFQVKVVLDKKTYDTYYKSAETVKKKLKERFDDVAKLYHGVNGKTFFDADIVYEPVFEESFVYDESSQDMYKKATTVRGKYPYLVLMDGCIGDHAGEYWHQDYTGMWNAESSCTVFFPANAGYADPAGSAKVYDILSVYQTSEGLAHELGHGRGVLDMYAMEVEAGKNQVNGEGFEAVTCIMNMCWGGTTWSEYAQLLINRNKNYTPQDSKYHDMYELKFPAKLNLAVTKGGKALAGATVNIYLSAAYSYAIDNKADFTDKTPASGVLTYDPKKFYTPRWDNYLDNGIALIEVVDDGKKYYRFLPLYEVQTEWLKGNTSEYKVTIAIK